jgi:4-amino-4-deoxy-L-arabinose transferase-like glycosyltransferase
MRFSERFFAYGAYFLLVLPLLFLPLGFDFSVFFAGGKTIANGGKLYVDFIDIKPPLVYYIFTVLYFLFKNNTFLYQLANFLFFFLTVILTFEVAKYIFKNKFVIFFSPIPMIMFVASFNYNYIFELELFFNLILVLSALLLFQKLNSLLTAILLGVLSGLAFGLKYTFGIVLVPILLYQFIEAENSLRRKLISVTIVSFLITALLPFAILYVQNGTLGDFGNVWKFLIYYQSTGFFSPKSIQRITNNIDTTIPVFYSLLFTITFFYGVWKIFLHWDRLDNKEKSFHAFLLLTFFFMFLSLIIEHQFLNYHFLRLAFILSIYSSFGLHLIFFEARQFPKTAKYFLALVLIFSLVFFTALPRYIITAIPTYLFFKNKEKYIDYFENTSTANTLLRQHTTIARLLNQNLARNDTVMILGGAAQIYTMINDCHISAFPTSVFVLSRFKKPSEWEQRFLKELRTAKFLIIQDFDHNHFFGEEISSWEAFNRNPNYRKILNDRYKLVLETFSFYVFQRKE